MMPLGNADAEYAHSSLWVYSPDTEWLLLVGEIVLEVGRIISQLPI